MRDNMRIWERSNVGIKVVIPVSSIATSIVIKFGSFLLQSVPNGGLVGLRFLYAMCISFAFPFVLECFSY